MAQVKFYSVTAAQYAALQTKDVNALYFLSDTGRIYKGDQALARDLTDTEKTKFDLLNTDYTAWEIYPNATAYPVGTLLTSLPWVNADDSDFTGKTLKYAIPSQMTEKFVVRSYADPDTVDVMVDFGDGTQAFAADLDASHRTGPSAKGEYTYIFEHTYANSEKYIIKIYGRQYIGTTNANVSTMADSYNLMTRCLETDLPIASHLNNLGNFASCAPRLLRVSMPSYFAARIWSFAELFKYNQNLIKATGFAYLNDSVRDVTGMFVCCNSLETTDFVFPCRTKHSGAYGRIFAECYSLAVDIAGLFPAGSFNAKELNAVEMFRSCALLTGTVPAAKLWEDPNITWSNTAEAFYGCSETIRAQVPTSWGGTNTVIESKIQSGYWKHVEKHELDSLESDLEWKTLA